MDFLSLILIAIGLSMDALSVAICKGLALPKAGVGKCAIVGLWFGGFQALMPILGYFVGVHFRDTIESFDHWVAFLLLSIIGINMIREALEKKGDDKEEREECGCSPLAARKMFPMAVATSIDALAVGVGFACLGEEIWMPAALIGITTFLLSMAGVKIGNIFGSRYKSKAELAGGVTLILIGLKILLEHTVLA
jgi:putative Mn2+ efflux pump MntP